MLSSISNTTKESKMQNQVKKKTLKVYYIKNSQFENNITSNLEQLREMRLYTCEMQKFLLKIIVSIKRNKICKVYMNYKSL